MESLLVALAVANAVAFCGGFSKGLAGFGAPLVMVPLFGLWLPLTVAVPVTILLSLFATLPMLRVVWPIIVPRRDLFTACCFSAGAAFGVHLLVTLPEESLRFGLGTLLMIFVAYMFLRTPAPSTVPEWTGGERARLGGAAATQGVLSGAVGGGALPMVPYLTIRYPRTQARAIFVVVFSIGTLVQILGYAWAGLVDADLLTLGAGAVPGLGLGLFAGAWLHHRVNPRLFARIIALVLILPALNLVGLI